MRNAHHGIGTRKLRPGAVAAACLVAMTLLCAGSSALAAEAAGSPLRGVALSDLDSPLARAAEAWVRANPPEGMPTIDEVVFVAAADASPARPDRAELIVDVVGRPEAFRAPKHRVRRREPTPDVVRLNLAIDVEALTGLDPVLAGALSDADGAASPVMTRLLEPGPPLALPSDAVAATIQRRWAFDAMTFALRVSLEDRTVVLEDARGAFRRVFPAAVGALDSVRHPGRTASLTPITDGARIRAKTSFERLSSPSWARGLPFMTLEMPTAWRGRDGVAHASYYPTRLAFHAFTTYRFMRGFKSRGCVTLRDHDLQTVADALFFGAGTIPLVIQTDPFADAHHPMPHERAMHFVLENAGTEAEPVPARRGNLWATKKVLGPPPVDDLAGYYMDGEARMRTDQSLANHARKRTLHP